MACPMAIQVHCVRIPANAILSADTIRPATVIVELPFGISALNGTLLMQNKAYRFTSKI
jgi:hypothetical protein